MATKKIGVYLCSGCGIGDAIDIEGLAKITKRKPKADICRTHPNLCSKEGLDVINSDIENEGINGVVIGACSPRVMQHVFNFDPLKIITERVNLREHVAWCQKPKDEDTQMMAEDYIRMGIVKVQKSELPTPFLTDIDKTVLVVGGGVTGMTSALESAKAGYKVVLVEKEAELGGFLAKCYKRTPMNPPYDKLEDTGCEELIKEVESNENIKVYKSAKINRIAGMPGVYDVDIAYNGSTETIRIGAVVLATGWEPYDASKLEHLGYGKCKNVVTNVEMEEIAKKGNGVITRPSDGKTVKSAIFIQCAGQRDKEHLPYCSAVCCNVSLKQARYIREQDPEAKAYIIYKDMRSPAQSELFYKAMQNDEGLFLTKGEIKSVTEDGDGGVIVEAVDTILGEDVSIKADMAVLATGMVPTTAKEIKEGLELAEKIAELPEDSEEKQELIKKNLERDTILNLKYRQGPSLPELNYGFPDSHYVCFPYETRRTGIYTAGCVRQPMDIGNAMEDAAGAVMKSIQCLELAEQGKAVHPRVGDMTYPEFFLQRCTQCKRCTEECPFGTLDEDEKGTPQLNETRCRRCSICMGACPERIISFKNYSVDMISSMVKAIEVPEEDEEKPRILAFMCENDAYPAADMAGLKRLQYNPYIRIIPLRCLGSINLVWVADSMSSGIDGILMMGCKKGDDYQCHMIKGSELAHIRLSKVKETLDRLRLESDRIRVLEVEISDYDKIPAIFDEFLEKINEVGPNPYKEF
ncbi:MAG: FAD-dependent oxidoreductase [Nitrospirae bacterium]|nr:MAG: FAD-dependent oxidoreductase [Nitrospirota bacterium]